MRFKLEFNPRMPTRLELRRSVKTVIIPLILGLVTLVLLTLLLPFGGNGRLILSVVGAGAVAMVARAVPKMMNSRQGARIDDDLPFFITHFGVLATSNLPRQELVRMVSENQEYKEIAGEMARVLRLTTDWGLGLADAVRAVALSTPSKTFSAFLLRLAHSLEAGQPLENFLMGEQKVVMADYTSLYHADLLRVESWKEIYTNVISTLGFLSIFAVILPLFTGGSATIFTLFVAGFIIVLEVLLGVVLAERLPRDRLSPNRPIKTKFERRLRQLLLMSMIGAMVLFLLVYLVAGTGPALIAAAIPMAVPGVYAGREEAALRRREADYPAFIRSLGAAAAARGGAIRGVLGNILANNLGELQQPVQDLYRRLMWRVDDRKTWRTFGEQTESRLIDSFSDMFVHGIAAGGKPGPISQIISDNMLGILALRTHRRATAGTFRGLLMGLGVGLAIVLFMGSGIFSGLTSLFGGGENAQVLEEQGLFHFPPPEDAAFANQILLVLMAAHGAAAGTFYQLVQGGRKEGATLHAAIQVALCVGSALLILAFMPSVFGFIAGGN